MNGQRRLSTSEHPFPKVFIVLVRGLRVVTDIWQCRVFSLSGLLNRFDDISRISKKSKRPGFFGDVRGAIILSRRPVAELASDIGVEPLRFSDFRAGEAELPAASLDRLLKTLGFRLMQEIPR
jgi:hypothetical protein